MFVVVFRCTVLIITIHGLMDKDRSHRQSRGAVGVEGYTCKSGTWDLKWHPDSRIYLTRVFVFSLNRIKTKREFLVSEIRDWKQGVLQDVHGSTYFVSSKGVAYVWSVPWRSRLYTVGVLNVQLQELMSLSLVVVQTSVPEISLLTPFYSSDPI